MCIVTDAASLMAGLQNFFKGPQILCFVHLLNLTISKTIYKYKIPVSNISESLLENGNIADIKYLSDEIDSSFVSDEDKELNDIEDTDTESDYGIQDSLYPYMESIKTVRKVVKKLETVQILEERWE